ncbi:MAG: DUF2969 family protein [Leuconostoc gelidum]|jgi:hypothetical protein|uniref:DUF2969 family protein n=1 Tax=Leuconostoc gelidum subsp. gelidum TaxID=1607839 RepID=A0AB35G181_LEUGE|nr:DUF2969 family protein [Leuconostoc gelidum]AFS39771.1 hypothetical protein C269_01620 [Leuconostoc gelidum JB7]MBZ5964707.1 DUF2969 family protein [Leuconostoc gelidum subsp. gelidum]MBZ5974688.1 DUF2969 family protein [Leuconostoc gelidum subsp. gelidum]MBZ5977528.1 DUF2969 family protein [Leuconostoc gelidum subsp. gelidum]MBZ5979192.1 DUF2969 family protein [Leuconostoc gelidum subsp. gelidum]
MRKKNQNFSVDLVVVKDQTQVMIDSKQVGYIEKADRGFVGYFGQQAVINQAKTQDEALQAILASFNLYQ